MIIVNHECYISLEIAKLLKEVGFDWECRCYYETSGKLRGKNNGSFYNYNSPLIWQNNGNTDTQVYSAPTLDVAQRWLREVKGYYIAWEFNMNISSWGSELYDFTNISVYIFVDSKRGNICKCRLKENYKMVEEAQEAGIKKALEIILEKGE